MTRLISAAFLLLLAVTAVHSADYRSRDADEEDDRGLDRLFSERDEGDYGLEERRERFGNEVGHGDDDLGALKRVDLRDIGVGSLGNAAEENREAERREEARRIEELEKREMEKREEDADKRDFGKDFDYKSVDIYSSGLPYSLRASSRHPRDSDESAEVVREKYDPFLSEDAGDGEHITESNDPDARKVRVSKKDGTTEEHRRKVVAGHNAEVRFVATKPGSDEDSTAVDASESQRRMAVPDVEWKNTRGDHVSGSETTTKVRGRYEESDLGEAYRRVHDADMGEAGSEFRRGYNLEEEQ